MKMSKEILSGQVELFNQKFNFDFHDDILTVYVSKELLEDLLYFNHGNGMKTLSEKKELPSDYIYGVTNINQEIIFNINKEYYSVDSFIPMKSIHRLYIPVQKYMKHIGHSDNKENVLYIYSNSLKYIFNFIPYYNRKENEDKAASTFEITINQKNSFEKTHFEINGINYTMKPTFNMTWGYDMFSHLPGISIKIDNLNSKEEVIKIYDSICNTIKFLHLRKNLAFSDVQFIHNGNKYAIYSKETDIKEDDDRYYINNPSVAKWEHVSKNIGNIVNYFYDNSNPLLLSLFFNDVKERFGYSLETFQKEASVFENIFREVFPNLSSSPESEFDKELIRRKMDNEILLYTGRKKDIYNYLKSQVGHVPLSAKILHCLKFFSSSLQEFNKYSGFTDQDYILISEENAGIRNGVDHGKDEKKIDKNNVDKLIYLRVLIIVLYYYNWGYSLEEIKHIISDLYNIK